jgi:SAM-dependent methyltransferase
MKKEYDDVIALHYKDVAGSHGLSPTSTMADEITRAMETDAITNFVGDSIRRFNANSAFKKATIMDVGCGNGFTLSHLFERYPEHHYVGIEKSDELRALAASRFSGNSSVQILSGDIREKDFASGIEADILICQRVLINLLSIEDQKAALIHIVDAVKSPASRGHGGSLLFIEGFASPLARLNEARSEFDLSAIPEAHHNLYLPDDFFLIRQLENYHSDGDLPRPNFLSTHYYVTRVLHPLYTPPNRSFKRNSEFVRFFTEALQRNAGDYSSLKLYMFEKCESMSPS